MSEQAWHHPFWFESHRAEPDMARTYIQGGTGNREAPCLACAREGRSIAVIESAPASSVPAPESGAGR